MTVASFILRFTHRTLPKLAIGVAVVTPVVAVAQGCMLLNEFRQLHGDAPRPVIPSRGVVVVRSDDDDDDDGDDGDDDDDSENHSHHHYSSNAEEPLRLLVIGDSLAAGVGVTSSGTPVLPEVIAKALSRALNGRAVFWTCVGTPGASSSQIVRELQGMEEKKERVDEGDGDDDNLSYEENKSLEIKFAEWISSKLGSDRKEKTQLPETAEKDEADAAPEVKNPIVKWVTKIQTNVEEFSKSKIDEVAQQIIQRRRTKLAETIIVSQYVSQYDIAVILTGLNDLKQTYIPFMMTKDQKHRVASSAIAAAEEEQREKDMVVVSRSNSSKRGSVNDYSRIVDAVQSKMRPGRPLVVFPGIPIATAPVFQLAPLNWFLVPLLQKIDDHKKALAETFPGLVLYVEAPSPRALSDAEAQQGPLWSSRQTEKVLLKLTDVGHNVREKVEQLMKQHYQGWTKDAEEGDDDEDDTSLFRNDDNSQMELSSPNSHHSNRKANQKARSTLVAPDMVHPNDLGYDIWGRHIAAAIVNRLNRNE
jgi:hypothetical protein